MYVCNCKGVTEAQARSIAASQVLCDMLGDVAQVLRSTNGCCKCLPRIKEIINEEKQARTEAAAYYTATSSTGEVT